MKLKRTFKTLLMIIATVMSVVSGILIDSGTLAYAATTYTLTLNWDDGVEWVATDKDGIYRWEKGGSKTFQAGSKAYTYVKLKNGATIKSFFSRQENYEWTDYTYISGDLCYDTWTMHDNRNVDIYTSVSSSADVSYDWDNLVTGSKHYHSSNGNESSWSNLRDDLGRSPAPVYSIYYKLQENRYRETCYGDNQEDKDFGGYEIMLRTEDSHNSYWYGQSSYANGDRFDDWYRDEFEGIKLSNLAIVPVQIKGDKFLQINISVKNTNSYAKEISLATCSDIQVADDDNAATFFNGNGFTMTNMYCETSDNYPFGTIPTATLNVYAKDVPGYVTDADAVYIGHFVYRKEHVWLNNVLGDKATNYNKYAHGGTSGEGELDSGFSIAWKNRTIAAGQTQTYSYIIGIGKYNSDNKITFNANGGELKTPGTSINNPSGNYSNKVTVTYGTDTYSSMSNDIPERAGYTFDGWWTTPNDSNASVMVYDASGKCNNDCNYWKNNQWQGTNDLTVYAHWKANTYTVRLNTGDIPSSELTKLIETALTEGWTWNENGRYFSKAFIQNENNYLPGVNKFFSANNYESVGSKVTDKYFVQDKTKNPTKVLYNWWTSASGGTDIGRGKKIYNNLYEISKDNSGIVNLYPHWMGYTTVFNYSDTAPSNTAGQTVTINNNINDGMDNNLYQIYGNCFFYKGTDGEYHDYEGTNPDLKVTASIPNSNGYKYIFNGWHHKNWNYLTDGLGKLTYKNNYNIGQGKTSYSLSPHFLRVGINYNVRLNANVPDTESTLQVLHQNGISSYIYNNTSRYFSRELTYDDSQDMLSPDVYSLKGYHLISRNNWYTEKTGGNTVSAPCNNTEAEYPDWAENNWNLTTEDGATVDLYARWQANNYKIAYNLDGGTYGTSHPDSADYDTMVTIDNPSKSGYTFTGWTITGYNSTTSGHNAVTWSEETGTSYKNLTATDGATVTFTATWSKEAPKTANLQTTGDVGIKATSHPDKAVVNIGSNVQVSAVLNTGYVFKGWYNGDVKVSDDLSFVYTMPNKDTVLTAKTEIKWYTMTFDPNGGILKNPGNNLYNAEWKNGNTVSVGWNINDFCYMNGDIPTRRGYRFTGWYLGSESVYNKYGIAIKNSSLYSYDTDYHWRYDGNVTVKAGWDAINYKISYKVVTGAGNIPSQTVHYGDSFTLADGNAFTYTGHTFSHWYVRRSSDKKVFCYDGNWHTTDGSDLYGSDVSNWYPYNNSGLTFEMNDSWIRSDTDADEEFVFWGFWTADEYNIIYNLDGGTLNGKTNPDTYNIETPTFTLNNPTKTGYIFEGWCESKDTSYVYNRNANEVIKKDESDSTSYFIPECYASLDYAPVFDPAYYLAKYPDLKSVCGDDVNKALSHFVNYGMKEGRQGSAEFEVNAYKAKYKDLKDAFGDNLPKYYIHYILAGKSEGRTISQVSISIYQGSIGNRTYTATWTPIEYSIVYTKGYTNNAKDDVIQSGIKYNKDVTLISNPFTGRSYTVKYSTPTTDRDWDKVTAPAGFNGTLEFAHWNILSKTYAAGTKLKNLTTKNGDKITATAQWKDKKFTLPVVSRPGYVFAGWYSMVDRKVYKANTEYTISQALTAYDNTFTAQWTAKTDTPYKVEHYKMNLDGTTYTLADTDNFKGTTDTSVTPAVKTYEGFTSPSTQTVTIKGDGTTVVKYYYTRNKYTLALNGLINGTLRGNLVDVVKNPITGAEDRHTAGTSVVTVNGTVVGNKVTDYCNEVYYGSSISIITTAESGYSIIDNGNVNFTMPSEGKTVTVTINAKDTKYLVRHWKKNVNTDSKTYNENSLNDSNYTMYDAEYLNGKAYSWVKPVVRTLEGFTYKGVLPSEGTAYVKPDGTTVIDVYYTRNTYTINGGNVNANVEYGNGISSVSGLKTYEYEQKVTLTANLKVGYHWHGTDKCASSGKYPTGWYSRNNSGVDGILTDNTTYNSQTIKFNMPARNVYLGVKATNNSYTVVYNKNQPVEPKSISNVTGSTESQTFIYDESQNLRNNGFTLTGYTRKSGWVTKPSKNGNGTADFSYGQSVKNLTTVNLGTVNLYAIWEDNAPEEINISSTNDFAATQTVTLTARDYGSGIDYISFGKDEKYEKVTCNADGSVTFTRKVNASGTYVFSIKDKNGKVSKKTITFYQTTLNTNKNNIVSSDGKNVIESDFTSVPETLSTYISINEAGKSITPVTKRDGVDFLGWSTDRKGKTGIISIKADGNKTYYAIWKDTINPLVVITDVSNKDADSQTIKFNLYDLDADLTDKDFEGKNLEYIRKHGEKTGSDIAAYWFGKNPVYNGNGNSRTVTEIVKDEGYSVNLERTVGEAVTYYIFAEDKAGNISKTTIAVDANGNVTPNNDLTFCSLTLNANDGLIQENRQNTIQKLIRKGNTYNLTNVHAERTGYHDTESDTDGVSMHWSHEIALGSNIIDEDKQTVIGTDNSVNPESLTEWEAKGNDTLYTKWTPNAYTLKVYLNKPVKATEDINTYNTVSSDTNKWVYDTYTGYYKTVLVYDKVWSIPDSAEFAGLTGWTTTGFKNVGKAEKSDIIYLNSLNRSYDEADDVSKASDIGTNLTSVKGDAVAYTMLWKENRYTVNFRANGGTAVKRVTLLEKKIDGSVKERTVDTTASADKKATDKTYDTSIIIGYESMIKVLDSPVRPGFAFTFFTKDKDYAKTAHMKDDKPDFDKSVLCTGELSEEAAKKYREEYKITGSLNGDEEVNLYSSWSKRKPVTLQSFISANLIRTDANALTKIALGTYITRDNAKDINSAWFNKNYKTNDKGEYVMNDTVEVLQEWDVTKTEIKQTYSKKIMADNN